MKTYADLDLKKIREECGLDFARHTYSKHQCSCCYGPQDMPAKFWAKGKKPKKINKIYDEEGLRAFSWDRKMDEIPYILFKNAYNGSGYIESLDQQIENYTCVEYHFVDDAQKIKVCKMLQDQLGDEYIVQIPSNSSTCIVIFTKDGYKNRYGRRRENHFPDQERGDQCADADAVLIREGGSPHGF